MASEVFANLPGTAVLFGGTSAPPAGSQETWTVQSSASFPAVSNAASPPTQLHVGDIGLPGEIITVTNISGTTWTVTRGAEGTTPVVHKAGFTVYQVTTAGVLAGFQSAYNTAPDWFNIVTQFGADPTGAADSTTAINNAITAAAAASVGFGVVYLPAGTFKTTGSHEIPLNVSVIGDGKGITKLNHRGVGTYCFFIGSTTGGPNPPNYMGRVGGFTISGQSAGNGSGSFGQQIGINVLNCLFFNVQDVHFTLLYEAMLIDGGDENVLGAGTFAGNGYVANCTASNVFIGYHVYRWVTDTLYAFIYCFGNSPITTGSTGIWFDTKPTTSTLLNSSCEGLDTGIIISTSRQGLCFVNPRLENCNTYVSWQNNTWGHTIIGGSLASGVWAAGTSAGSVTQIAEDGWFPAINALPAASSSYRHALYRVDGGTGVADGVYLCAKTSSNTYSWNNLIQSPAASVLLAATTYNPGTATPLTTTAGSNSFQVVSAPNLSVTFTAPSSGQVLVRLTGIPSRAGTGAVFWGLSDGNSAFVTGSGGQVMSSQGNFFGLTLSALIAGLTPANSYTWQWAQRTTVNSGSDTASLKCGGDPTQSTGFAPATMEIWAA